LNPGIVWRQRSAPPEARPYKGPLSYEIEDSEYFFGRDRESDLLLAKILSAKFTLLHAQSGAGKTSLLNARVLPGLEQNGWTAFRILPRGNPSDAIRLGVLLGLLPPAEAEYTALDRALALFWAPGEDPTLSEVLQRFDEGLQAPDPRRREALSPVEGAVEIRPAALSYRGPVRPLLLRLLRATLELSQYCEHILALRPDAGEIRGDTRASELRRILSEPETIGAHNPLLEDLYIPSPSLTDFFSNLLERYGRLRTQFGLVLILDQFEELFTLFTDSLARPASQLWRLKWEFVDQLEGLYKAGAALPIRYVISMRDEYIAQLDAVRRFVRDLDASSFHLSFLEKTEARLAIREPAKLFNYDYSEECYRNILEVLVREDRFVEPAPLQIVCERLWRERLRAEDSAAGDGIRMIPLSSLPEGGTRTILDSFFDEVLAEFETSADRAEALEMLGPLVTVDGTRNIVARDALVKVPFRNAQKRLELLNVLAQARVVRIERRLGGQFVEISHEFLISSILAKIREVLDSDPEYGRFRWTIRTLDSFRDVQFRANTSKLLGRQLFESLHGLRYKIDWEDNGWATELMLRSAVVCSAPREVIREWAARYRKSGFEPEPDAMAILTENRMRESGLALLTLEELAIISSRDPEGLSAREIEFVLRSQLLRSGDRHRHHIIRWTKEFKRACDREIQHQS
jgi:hypothetical protein